MARLILSDQAPNTKIAFPFASGWSSFGGGLYVCTYRKDPTGMVWLEGLALAGVAKAAGSVIGTLPAGFSPLGSNELYLPVTVSAPGQQPGGVYVSVNGNVVINQPAIGATGWVSLSSIYFLAA